MNVDEEPELADRFGVTAIPMLVLVASGKEVARDGCRLPVEEQQLEEALLG
ncbi:MAG: thioredoxin family protein [Lachnospiraceae bacterium]